MGNLLRTGSAWLEARRKAYAASAVTYHRGAASVELQATIGETPFEIVTEGGIVERHESRDYIVQAADLVLGGAQTEPVAGDLIKETLGGTVEVFQVMAPGGEPAWRYSDAYRVALRIHTKRIGTE